MVQASQKAVIGTVIVASVILLIALFFAISSINNNMINEINDISVPTAAEIAALVVIPEVNQSVDNEKLDKVCELTDGCEFYEIEDSEGKKVYNKIKNTSNKFKEELSDLLDIDEDDFVIVEVVIKDKQVRAYTKYDKNNENYEVKAFVRVIIDDDDEEDDETIYVLVTSVLDEGDYDDLSIEEVDRHFEFE